MTPDPLTPIMQAAERLRRDGSYVIVERTGADVTGQDFDHAAYRNDVSDLADFALSILPKGDRPVAMMTTDSLRGGDVRWAIIDGKVSDAIWDAEFDDGCFMVQWSPTVRQGFGGLPYYATEAEAKRALHWMKFDELLAASP